MKLTTRIADEEVREHAAELTAVVNSRTDVPMEARLYLHKVILDVMAQSMNHAFAEGRSFERHNPIKE